MPRVDGERYITLAMPHFSTNSRAVGDPSNSGWRRTAAQPVQIHSLALMLRAVLARCNVSVMRSTGIAKLVMPSPVANIRSTKESTFADVTSTVFT